MKEKGLLQLLEYTDHNNISDPDGEETGTSEAEEERRLSRPRPGSDSPRPAPPASEEPLLPSNEEHSGEMEVAYLRERAETSYEKPLREEKRRPELRVRHSIHDRFQVESNLTFDLRPRTPEEKERHFKVDFYLHIPVSVGVNSSTFDGETYFRHWTSYFRVRAPQFYHLRVLPPEEFRIESADSYFSEHLCSIKRKELGPRVVQDVKLFGNFLYTELKKLSSALPKKKSKKAIRPEKRRHLAAELVHRIALLNALRERYLVPMRSGRFLVDDEVQRAFVLTDEYLSYRAELVLVRARENIPERREELNRLLAEEVEYRDRHDMLVLKNEKDNKVLFEAYTYRLGLLKKYLGEALFLRLQSCKKDNLYKNYAAAVGAGLAATVAGLAEHQRVQYLTGNDSGLRLAILIGVAVVAYIFKDRVKDLSKEYFNSRLKEGLPDKRFALFHKSVTPEGRQSETELGIASEYFRFVKEPPADVVYLRNLGQTKKTDPVRREEVLHVARRFQLNLNPDRKMFPLLKNIVRLDVSPFLSKLDNPTTPVSYYGNAEKVETVQAPKVYHINGVLRYEVNFGTDPGATRVDYERIRLIINKNGIVRLDKVMPAGRLAYTEPES